MRIFSCVAKTGLLATLALTTSYGAIVTTVGNAYGASGVRAGFLATMPPSFDDVNLTTECTIGCGYSFNRMTGSNTAGPLVNVSGQTISGVRFVGTNTGLTNTLYVRPLTDGIRNSNSSGGPGVNYNQLNASQGVSPLTWPGWTIGFATAPVTTTGIISVTADNLPVGTRSVAFDYASIGAGTFDTVTINVRTASGTTPLSRPAYLAGTSNYNSTTGPGFYGATSTEDILEISVIANASNSPWILNIANFRVGVQINAPTPEPTTFLAMGSALILLSFLLRRRGKFARGGAA